MIIITISFLDTKWRIFWDLRKTGPIVIIISLQDAY